MRQDSVRPPLKFLPPRPDPLLIGLADLLLPLWVRYKCGIRKMTTVNADKLVAIAQAFLQQRARVIFAFRHPTIDDQYALLHLFGRVLPQTASQMGLKLDRPLRPYFAYDRGIPLWAGEFITWLYPRMGGISVYRSKADRTSLQFIRQTLRDGLQPLAIAPEGGTNGCSEEIRKLEPGVAQLGFWCVEDLVKANRSEEVWIVPLGFQYLYSNLGWERFDQFLLQLEQDCGIVKPLPRSAEERYRRLYELGDYMIDYVSHHYQKFYPLPLPTALQSNHLQTRLHALLDHILTIAEYHFGLSPKGDYIDRCRRLEQMVWEQVFRGDIKDVSALSPFAKGFANQLAQEALNSEWHMRLAESIVHISGEYVVAHPSPTRFAETLLLVWRVIDRVKGNSYGRPPYLGLRDCRISIGEILNVNDRYGSYKQNRPTAVQELTEELQKEMQKLIVPSPL